MKFAPPITAVTFMAFVSMFISSTAFLISPFPMSSKSASNSFSALKHRTEHILLSVSRENDETEIEECNKQFMKGFSQKVEKIAMYSAMSSLLLFSSLGNLFNPVENANAAADLKAELKQLSNQVLLQEKLLQASKMDKKVPSFNNLPDGTKITGKEVKDAIARIRVLQAYLDEVERDIFQKEWKYVPGFIGVFGEQEEAFVKLIEGLYPSSSVSDRSSREALSYEAKKMFIELDNLREAAKYKRTNLAQKSYANIALSYDRFLKAGDLYTAYDPITSTEPFFANIEKKLSMPKESTTDKKGKVAAEAPPAVAESTKKSKITASTTTKEKQVEKKVETNTKSIQVVAESNKNTAEKQEKKAAENEKKVEASTTTASTSTPAPSSTVKVASEKANTPAPAISKAANDKPVSVIKFDEKSTPQVPDLIVVIGGPDKGKTGKLIGITDEKGVIKLDSNGKFSEVKIINMNQIGKQSK